MLPRLASAVFFAFGGLVAAQSTLLYNTIPGISSAGCAAYTGTDEFNDCVSYLTTEIQTAITYDNGNRTEAFLTCLQSDNAADCELYATVGNIDPTFATCINNGGSEADCLAQTPTPSLDAEMNVLTAFDIECGQGENFYSGGDPTEFVQCAYFDLGRCGVDTGDGCFYGDCGGPGAAASPSCPVPTFATPTSSLPALPTIPISLPETLPTSLPVTLPASLPLTLPTSRPVTVPISLPVTLPTSLPVTLPTSLPVTLPASLPVTLPTSLPVTLPTSLPVALPTSLPISLPLSLPILSLPSSLPLTIPTAPISLPLTGTLPYISLPTLPPLPPISLRSTLPSDVSLPLSLPTYLPPPPSSVPPYVTTPLAAPSSLPSSATVTYYSPPPYPTGTNTSSTATRPTYGPTTKSSPTAFPTIPYFILELGINETIYYLTETGRVTTDQSSAVTLNISNSGRLVSVSDGAFLSADPIDDPFSVVLAETFNNFNFTQTFFLLAISLNETTYGSNSLTPYGDSKKLRKRQYGSGDADAYTLEWFNEQFGTETGLAVFCVNTNGYVYAVLVNAPIPSSCFVVDLYVVEVEYVAPIPASSSSLLGGPTITPSFSVPVTPTSGGSSPSTSQGGLTTAPPLGFCPPGQGLVAYTTLVKRDEL